MIRLIELDNINHALQLSDVLKENFIPHQIKEQQDPDTLTIRYTLWLDQWDDIERAKNAIRSIEIYHAPEIPISGQKRSISKPLNWSLTKILLGLCIALFVLTAPAINYYLSGPKQHTLAETTLHTLLFDQPLAIDTLLEIAEQEPSNVSKINQLAASAEKGNSVWRGYLNYLRTGIQAPVWFEKIGSGQLWRLITPIFLHANIIHLFFNLLWLYFLGLQIEKRIGLLNFALLVISTAIVSNICQYLVSGYLFLGISGVISAFFGFIFARKRSAPWEAYRLDRQTSLFILGYLLINLLVELVQLLAAYFNIGAFTIPIGTTAHLSGALVGWVIGSIDKFSASV